MRPTRNTLIVLGSLGLVIGTAGAFAETRTAPESRPSASPTVIPLPVSTEPIDGQTFVLGEGTPFVVRGAVKEKCLTGVVASVRGVTGLRLEQTPNAGVVEGAKAVTLRIDEAVGRGMPEWQAAEAYRLTVAGDGRGVEIAAANEHGLFNGAQTLVQLLKKDADGQWSVAPVRIRDYPRFQWRGYLIDPARIFRPKKEMLRIIDLLALHKLNVLQVHLTDDQGWRIEIKKYPKLTELGASMPDQVGQRGEGRFYTQADIQEMVAYAAERYIMIVPEIEMPGHSGAATTVYPELGCAGQQASELCVTNPHTVEFVTDVLTEVAAMFPSPFIHIGADEVQPERWRACPRCNQRMKELTGAGLPEGLKTLRIEVTTGAGRPFNEDIGRLQGEFVRRIDAHLAKLGKRMIGWDEIVEGGLAKESHAAVSVWRSGPAIAKVTKLGCDVAVCVYPEYYLDNDLSLAVTYAVEPAPPELSAEQAGHVLGLQGNMWGEMTRTQADVDRRTYPRLCALAEVGWTPREARHFEDFLARLREHARLLRSYGVSVEIKAGK